MSSRRYDVVYAVNSAHLLCEATPILAKSSERYAGHKLGSILPLLYNGNESRARIGYRLGGVVWRDRVRAGEHGGELDSLLPEGVRSNDRRPSVC